VPEWRDRVAVRHPGQDGDEPGHPEHGSDLPRHVQDAASGTEPVRCQRQAARPEQRRDGQPHPGAAQQLDGQQVGDIGRRSLDPEQPQQLRQGVDEAADHRDPPGATKKNRQPRRDQAGERQHHERPGRDGQPGYHGGIVPYTGEELHRAQHERAEPGVVQDRGGEGAAEAPRAEQTELDDRGVVPP
jgi:hypothetical protein